MNNIFGLDVSRETIERLEIYAAELEKWNTKINLVSKSTLPDLWDRHILDSAQLLRVSPKYPRHWADLGSGGGFPGLVAAIVLAEKSPVTAVSLVESDQRKCAFLQNVLRATSVSAKVIAKRIESAPPLDAHVISARALADLSTLFALSEAHAAHDCVMLFLKGKTWQEELREAQRTWRFDHEVVKSETSNQSVILRISGISRG